MICGRFRHWLPILGCYFIKIYSNFQAEKMKHFLKNESQSGFLTSKKVGWSGEKKKKTWQINVSQVGSGCLTFFSSSFTLRRWQRDPTRQISGLSYHKASEGYPVDAFKSIEAQKCWYIDVKRRYTSLLYTIGLCLIGKEKRKRDVRSRPHVIQSRDLRFKLPV